MNEELDSQLSAMFDDELPAAECELLARRLSRDEQLQGALGPLCRHRRQPSAPKRGVRLNADLARRVSAVISTEPDIAGRSVRAPARQRARHRWWQAGRRRCGVAAGVAAVSIFWMRSQAPE